MEEFLRTHKDVAFGWVLAVEMGALWLQAALAARGASRHRRDAVSHGKSGGQPRLMAPR
ncbi:MAG TPA: hypothetical protein VGI79_11530 [Caulobacteraceae bacterium]|jgi:hypothetical protein